MNNDTRSHTGTPFTDQPERIEALWRGGKLRLWLPRARPYGNRRGSAVVWLTPAETEALRDLLADRLAALHAPRGEGTGGRA